MGEGCGEEEGEGRRRRALVGVGGSQGSREEEVGGGLLVVGGRGGLVLGGDGLLVVGGGGGLLVGGGGGGLLVEGACAGLLAPAGLELGLATFCSTAPWMVLALVRATAGRPWPPWPLRPRNLSSSGVAGPPRGPSNWGAFRGPCSVYPYRCTLPW